DLRFWVANAKDPKKVKFAGAQNQTFYPYNLADLLAKDPTTLAAAPSDGVAPSSAPEEVLGPAQEGSLKSRRLIYGEDDSKEMLDLLKTYDPPSEEFEWKLEPKANLIAVRHHHLTFPSAVVTDVPENNTVHAEFYQPRGDGKHPGLVILHHLGGSMEAEEIIGGMLAADGIACLLVWMPYYEQRAPKDGRKKEEIFSTDLDASRAVTRQAILDVRRAGDWLAARPEVEGKRIGIMGISLGAIIGSMAQGIDLHFRKSVFVLGGGDLAAIVFNGSNETEDAKKAMEAKGVTLEQLREAWKPMDPLTYAPRVRTKDILMVNGRRDEIIPPACTERLNEAFGGPTIKWYPATHYSLVAYL
ncbi:MAG: alpha/beta hydrolase family protein, partial [Planctomycetota bacterium]